ncbi:hypothetical protein KC19_6G095200 [Ceratodon purpureus]|uniref:Uncharacterized protein n=1 Tax=Ceratodon purpureus TaxID=3225 RepID=A0A8T0HDX4_CERPU|nr:hypothetical protein KC19_6G095200 [Ceratodon purpureus]
MVAAGRGVALCWCEITTMVALADQGSLDILSGTWGFKPGALWAFCEAGDGEGDRYGQMSPSNINYEFSEGIPEMLLSRAKAGYVDDALLTLELGYRPVKVVLVAIGEVYLKEVSS